jgi:hypothetical protein
MHFLGEELEEVGDRLGYAVTRLRPEDADRLRASLLARYSEDPVRLGFGWLRAAQTTHDPNAWRSLGGFTDGRECLLFFPADDEPGMWQFHGGDRLVQLLSETTQADFFLASPELEFLIYFDDHDCVIACGDASPWVASLRGAASTDDE